MQFSAVPITIKTAWYVLACLRNATGQKDETHQLSGVVEFDDAFFGSPTIGKKRRRGTEKATIFVALSLDENGNLQFLKIQVSKDIKQASVKAFAQHHIVKHTIIHIVDCCIGFMLLSAMQKLLF